MRQMRYATAVRGLVTIVLIGGGGVSPAMAESGFGPAQERSDQQRELRGPSIREEATSEATESSLPGNRRVTGRMRV